MFDYNYGICILILIFKFYFQKFLKAEDQQILDCDWILDQQESQTHNDLETTYIYKNKSDNKLGSIL